MEPMEVHITYPVQAKRSFWRRNARALWRSLFLFLGYLCLLINLLTGGMFWSLIVIGGLTVVWVAALYRPQVESTLIKKLCDTLIAVCLYLFLLDSLLGTQWSQMVVPIVFFGDLILIAAYFLLYFKQQKRNFLPLLELLVLGLLTSLSALLFFSERGWPTIVAGSVSLFFLLVLVGLCIKPLRREFQKKFSTR